MATHQKVQRVEKEFLNVFQVRIIRRVNQKLEKRSEKKQLVEKLLMKQNKR